MMIHPLPQHSTCSTVNRGVQLPLGRSSEGSIAITNYASLSAFSCWAVTGLACFEARLRSSHPSSLDLDRMSWLAGWLAAHEPTRKTLEAPPTPAAPFWCVHASARASLPAPLLAIIYLLELLLSLFAIPFTRFGFPHHLLILPDS